MPVSVIGGIAALVAGAFVGQPMTIEAEESLVNADQGQVEIFTVVVGGATNSTAYTLTLTDEDGNTVTTVTYTSDGSATTAEIAAGLLAAWRANPLAGAYASAALNTLTITLTGTQKGRVFGVTDNSGDLTTTNTQNANSGNDIEFGRAVVKDATTSGSANGLKPYGTVTAMVKTLTVTFEASTTHNVRIRWRDQDYTVQVAGASNSNTTASNIRTAINAVMPANSVDATVATNVVTLTSEIAGEPFQVFHHMEAGATTGTAVIAGDESASDDIAQLIGGITLARPDVEQDINGDAEYPPGRAMQVLRRGRVAVAHSGAPSGRHVYVGVGSSNSGLLYSSAAADRARLPLRLAQWVTEDSVDTSVAYVQLNLP